MHSKQTNDSMQMERMLFDINMMSCEKHRPSLHKALLTTEWSGRFHFFESDHESRAYNLLDIENQKLFYEQDDPLGSMAAYMEGSMKRLQGISLVLGFGLGYATLMLLNQRNFSSRSIIVVEPELEIFLAAFHTLDCRDILESPDVLIIDSTNLIHASALIQSQVTAEGRNINAKNVQIFDLPSSYEVNRDFYDNVLETAKNAIVESVKLVGNCPNDALQGLDNTLSNAKIQASLPGIKTLEGLFSGKPGIVVASGPSLDKNIHLLSEVGDKAVICAADASLRHLLSRNLKPHLIASLERLDETAKLFENLNPDDYQDVHMVASPIVHKDSFDAYKGPIITTEREYGYLSLVENNKGFLIPGPSAGNMAFRVLKYLGCSPIILVGQDLALNEDGKTHAQGDPYGDEQEVYTSLPIEVEGNYSPTLKSNPVLKMFHAAYEVDVIHFDGQVINCTEGGAKIAGTQLLTLREALDEYILTSQTSDETSGIVEIIKDNLVYPERAEVDASISGTIEKITKGLAYLDHVDTKVANARKAARIFLKMSAKSSLPLKSASSARAKIVTDALNSITEVTNEYQFRALAMDVVSAVFFHTMASFNSALANAKDDESLDKELAQNIDYLSNNFEVLLRYVRAIFEGHLAELKQHSADGPSNFFKRQTSLESAGLLD